MKILNQAQGLLSLVAITALLTSCASEPVNRYSGPGYIAGSNRDRGNAYGAGRTPEETSVQMREDRVSYWDGDGISGAPGITIDLSQQRAYFYKGQQLVGVSLVSTGTNQHPTPPGEFKITQKSRDHESNLYGDYLWPDGSVAQKEVDTTRDPMPPGARYDGADMPFFMRFNGGIGMHGGYLPGFPASHGCIRMPQNMARIFYENVELNTPVRVIR